VGEGLEPLRGIQPAAEILQEIMEEAEHILKNAPGFIQEGV